MSFSRKTWGFFFLLALLAVGIWYRFSYPQFSFINLSVERPQALKIAKGFIQEFTGKALDDYQNATVFGATRFADQYLQKAIGFKKEIEFLKEQDFELFYWYIRFFKENQKEEYRVTVSAATGQVTGYSHTINDTDFREDFTEANARNRAIQFLRDHFGFDLARYDLHSHSTANHDQRVDYSFSWEKKGIYIPWSKIKEDGGAKLLTSVSVSGDDILSFGKGSLDIPESFQRDIDRKMNVGRNLAILFRLFFFLLLTGSVFYTIVRRNDLIMHRVKRFCIGITIFLFVLQIIAQFNEFEGVLFNYPTTSSFASYLWRYLTNLVMDVFIVTISILMPSLAGESLRYEAYPEKRHASFLHYLNSSFFSREVSSRIALGYLVAVIMIGLQSLAFAVGQRYLGVWVEYTWMAQLSSSYLPFLAAFILGASAGISEEISFRMFSINLGKRFLKNTFWAVFCASLIWGYGHSTYLVFPMWFRGLEVMCLGLFLSWVYLRYGLITTLVAHFLFDVFWVSSAYLLGVSTPFYFYSALGILLLPFVLAVMAHIRNASSKDRPMHWQLNQHQKFNLEVLKNHLQTQAWPKDLRQEEIVKQIAGHGWDQIVVELAVKDWKKAKA